MSGLEFEPPVSDDTAGRLDALRLMWCHAAADVLTYWVTWMVPPHLRRAMAKAAR